MALSRLFSYPDSDPTPEGQDQEHCLKPYGGFSFVFLGKNRVRAPCCTFPYEKIGFGAILVIFHIKNKVLSNF